MNIKQACLAGTLLIDAFAFCMSPNEQLLYAAKMGGNIQAIEEALDNGADVNATDNRGWTALIYSAFNWHIETAKLLIANKADVNARTNIGFTALMYADINIIKLLIVNGADVDAQNDNGETALMLAANRRPEDIVMLLINNGANINTKNNNEWNALQYAAQVGRKNTVRLLALLGTDVTSLLENYPEYLTLAQDMQKTVAKLFEAIEAQDIDAVKKVLKETPIPLCIKDKKHNTPLHRAIINGNMQIATILAHFYTGALTIKNKEGQTPIHLAAIYCHDFLRLIVNPATGPK